ncbi:MAG TPA: hypothetical protein VFF81_13290 [Noviherbaspirillum sp.]|nr:hypothetical protein [Noviherbaspirillum sp.]
MAAAIMLASASSTTVHADDTLHQITVAAIQTEMDTDDVRATVITDAGKPRMEVVRKKGEMIEHYKSIGNIGQDEGQRPARRTG